MSRMNRDLEFIQIRIQKEDHDYLISQKHGTEEQLDAVLHRILGSYATGSVADAEFMYQEQVKVTQTWMKKCRELEAKLRGQMTFD